MPEPGRIRVGTSGWQYRHWRGPFYPPELPVKHWFAHYAATFDTLEVNNTFYNLPAAETYEAWSKQAPPGFLYALKASRYLTHRKKLKDAAEPLANVLGRARHLGPHLGPILYQLPPHWHCNLERLREFLALLPTDLTHVFEFRDPSWCNDGVRELLEEHGASYCIHDMRGFDCAEWVTGPVAYVRFHGPTEVKYAGRYDRAHLRQWADKMQRFAESGRAVYAYFNNDDAAYAVANALELREMLGVGKAALAQ
jgi:uncharacterized protein YecE (DUF72 family)